MIAALRGQILAKTADGAVIDCAGVGYGVAMSLTSIAALPAVGQTATLHVHTHVSQDAIRLYGFVEPLERATFLALLAAPGVGPRLSLTILSAISPSQLVAAVQSGDKDALRRIPGVGPKKAERMLLELRSSLDNIAIDIDIHSTAVAAGAPVKAPSLLRDVRSALENLGFAQPIADNAARMVLQDNRGEDNVAALVRLALRLAAP